MTENYGDWHEREMIEYADAARERDLEWQEWEVEQKTERPWRDEPAKKREVKAS